MSSLLSFFRPTVDAIFSTIPFKWRWRLLLLQPIYALSWCMTALPWVFSRRYSVLWIPIRTGQKVRTIVFQPPRKEGDKRLRPLHLDIHGGAFIGGAAEYDARWCAALSERTGAVVVSSQYRYAPRYTFPAAINDIDDVVAYLLKNAESDLGADPKLLTIGGSSAGGNLALAACQQLALQHPSPTSVKAAVTFCALVDLRIPAEQKPKPPGFPAKDPLAFLTPMYDVYGGTSRPRCNSDPRLNPIMADIKTLPDDMLFVIAGIDILLHEELTMVERLKNDAAAETAQGRQRRIEGKVYEKGFHGWLELPSWVTSRIIGEEARKDVYDTACNFIMDAHEKHGFNLHGA